jgi:predicted TIM-barrel fold metal-dependent hydrolase
MIIDSHTHAWAHWPYQRVPDPKTRGSAEQLLFEMDAHGVDQAVIICAGIEHNPDNNAYVAEQVRRYPDRLHQFADVDCSWSETYHQPGAASRLRQIAQRYPIKGFTHYLKAEDDGQWLTSKEGLAFFEVANELKLIVSLANQPHQQAAIVKVAQHFPDLAILIHHLGHPKVNQPETLRPLLASASQPNIFLKLSGPFYATQDEKWNFPFPDTHSLIRELYDAFGPGRLCWGSDYPVSGQFITYRQALEIFRTHCDFISDAEHAMIFGGNLGQLLNQR